MRSILVKCRCRAALFYNGIDECPDRQELKLSAAYSVQDQKPSLELMAILLNINPGHNKKLMKSCKTLKDYSEYVSRVRHYAQVMDISNAVEQAITECIKDGILADFLMKNRAEAKKMSIYEYDEVKHMRQTREEGYEEGYGNGYGDGQDKINLLILKLYEAGRMEDLVKAAGDKTYQQSLFEEFGL